MVINHSISFVTLVFCLIYVKYKDYCKTVSLYACGLLHLLWTNLEKISRILIFADLELPRIFAKIRRRENFPFYGISPLALQEITSLPLSFFPNNFVALCYCSLSGYL